MRAIRLLLAVLASFISVSAASAQVLGHAIVATVNDTPISTFDVQQRVLLLMVMSGGQMPPGAEAQFQARALRDLIEEQLKRQEAAEYDVQISDSEVNEELGRIAASGGGSIQDLAMTLSQQGIAIETLQEKIRAEKAWDTLVRGRYRSRVKITDREIDGMIDDMKAEKQQEQFLLSEICLPVNNLQERDQIYRVGMQMLGQMQQGVPFQALAQRFSVCPSAARGGDLGWMRKAEMEDDVVEIVSELNAGNVSTPLDMQEGDMMKIVAVRDKREAAVKGDPSYELAYAGVSKEFYSRAEAEEKLVRLPLTNPCTGDSLSTDLGEGIGVELLPMVPIDQIKEPFHNALFDLRRGDTSELLESTNAYHMVYVCEMDEGLGLPRRRMVKNRLEGQQFDLISRRYLRDVERDTDVEVRIDPLAEQQDS